MIIKYKKFMENNKNLNFYKNINNSYDGGKFDYYNIPFELGEKQVCIPDDDNFVVCLGSEYVYDYIKDDDIKNALLLNLDDIDITKDWTSVSDGTPFSDNIHATQNPNKHILRVAKIVKELLKYKPLNPISMYFDPMAYSYDIYNNIEDGNHRIRALQYLKYDGFPAVLGGSHAKYLIQYLKDNYNL